MCSAAREAAQRAVPAGDRRPLADIVSARLAAAGVTADQDEARFISQWNAQRLAAMGDAQKGPGA